MAINFGNFLKVNFRVFLVIFPRIKSSRNLRHTSTIFHLKNKLTENIIYNITIINDIINSWFDELSGLDEHHITAVHLHLYLLLLLPFACRPNLGGAKTFCSGVVVVERINTSDLEFCRPPYSFSFPCQDSKFSFSLVHHTPHDRYLMMQLLLSKLH